MNRLRKEIKSAQEAEQRAWQEISMSPGEHQRAVARRMPALFRGGRGLVTITQGVLDGTEEPKF